MSNNDGSRFYDEKAHWEDKLQKRTKSDEDREKRLIEAQRVSNVYSFLNDVIYKMADTEFDYFVFENAVVDGQKFMDDINYLRDRHITNQEFIWAM